MTRFEDYLKRKKAQYGSKFDPSELAGRFIPFFNSGERIKVNVSGFGEMTGTVGVTTGWRPVFLLMRRSNAMGSPITLGPKDKIIGVNVAKRGERYRYERVKR